MMNCVFFVLQSWVDTKRKGESQTHSGCLVISIFALVIE